MFPENAPSLGLRQGLDVKPRSLTLGVAPQFLKNTVGYLVRGSLDFVGVSLGFEQPLQRGCLAIELFVLSSYRVQALSQIRFHSCHAIL
jgi:hypothetical protein